jgi:Uma2 family endonuclease
MERIPRRGYAALSPDLVAEVLSPDDIPGEVIAKVGEWLAAGTRIVWLVDPGRSEVHVYRQDGSLSVLRGDDQLDGEDVVPGFACPVKEIFE